MNRRPLLILGVLAILGGYMPPPEQTPVQADPPAVVSAKPAEEFKAVVEELAPKAHDYGCDTYPIRARGYDRTGAARFPRGSAVSLGKGRFVTAAHIFRDLQSGYVVEVSIGDEWHKATSVQVDFKNDSAEAAIAKTDVDGVEARPVKFGERVTIYGLTTCQPMRGLYVGDMHVGLDLDTNGIDFGDSGGGVYGEDGALVGLISSFGDDRRSVYISPASPKVAPVSQVAPPPVEPIQSPRVQSCPGGVCPAPSMLHRQPPYNGILRRGRRN